MHHDPSQWDGNFVGGVSLVASNLALAPAIILLASRGDYAASFVLIITFIASAFYHMCRAGYCLMEYRMHITSDYLSVYMGMIWLISSLPFRPRRYTHDGQLHALLFFILYMPAFFAVLGNVHHSYQPLIGMLVPLIVVSSLSLLSSRAKRKDRRRLFRKDGGIGWAVAASVSMIIAGVFMYLLPESSYPVAHTIWHIMSMVAAYFVVRARAY